MSTRRSAVGQGRSAGTELSLSVQGGLWRADCVGI
jgi:hypothetical protein